MTNNNEPLTVGAIVSQNDLIRYWELGLINDAGYAFLAFNLEKVEPGSFDIEEFCDRWEAPPDDKERVKRLKTATVMVMLKKLESVGAGTVNKAQVQLDLDLDSLC